MSKYAYGFVYVWYDRKRKMYCVGSHHGREDDGYTSSTGHMRFAYKKRPQDFKRRIVARNYFKDCRRETQLLEQRWLDMIKLEELKVRYYNLSPNANGGRSKGWNHTEEAKKKISSSCGRPKGWNHTEEAKKKISSSRDGVKRGSYNVKPKTPKVKIKKIRTRRCKVYHLIDPQNNLHVVTNITKFCSEHNLVVASIFHVTSGRRRSCKGWTVAK